VATVVAYGAAWAVILFFLYYLFLFGLIHDKEVTLSFTYSFLLSQAMSSLAIQPAMMLAITVFAFAVWPAWMPYVIWIPVLGPLAAGKTAAALVSKTGGSGTLTGRMENLTLVRAAGAASSLPPDAALVAYGVTAVMSAALSSMTKTAARVAHGVQAAKGGAGGAGGEGGPEDDGEGGAAYARLSEAQRHELIVRRYLVAQLRTAELARRKTLALARARALTYSVGAAAQAFAKGGALAAQRRGGGGFAAAAAATAAASSAASGAGAPEREAAAVMSAAAAFKRPLGRGARREAEAEAEHTRRAAQALRLMERQRQEGEE
jgi:hypothetical protein